VSDGIRQLKVLFIILSPASILPNAPQAWNLARSNLALARVTTVGAVFRTGHIGAFIPVFVVGAAMRGAMLSTQVAAEPLAPKSGRKVAA